MERATQIIVSIHRDPLQAVIRQDNVAKDFLGIANVP